MTPRERTISIINSVVIPLGVSARDVIGPGRKHHIVVARHAACRALREQGRSYHYVARSVGRHDHTAAVHGCRADLTQERFRYKINQMAIMAAVTIAMVGDA